MISRVFAFFIVFISLLMVFGVYLGYSGNIYFESSALAVILSGALSFVAVYLMRKKIPEKIPKGRYWKIFLAATLIFIIIFGALILPEFIFPFTCSDLENHSRAVRIAAKVGHFDEVSQENSFLGIPLVYIHHYPNGLYAIESIFYSLFGNAYIIGTIFSVLCLFLISLGIYLLALKLTNPTAALLSYFISLFSIVTLWIIEHGFVPQIAGELFVISAVYAFVTKNRLLWLFSLIGIVIYPPLYPVIALFLILTILFESGIIKLPIGFGNIFSKAVLKNLTASVRKNSSYILLPILSFFIIYPEFFGLLVQYVTVAKFWEGALLIRGGIATPNLFGLLAFILALIPLWLMVAKGRFVEMRPVLILVVSTAIMSAAVVVYFALNWVFSIIAVKQVQSLYQAVKYFYFMLVPLSIFAALGFLWLRERLSKSKIKLKSRNILKYLLLGILIFELAYFAGYGAVLMQKDNQPQGYYSIVEKIDNLPNEFVVGVDECILNIEKFDQLFIYKSLIDVPDPAGPNLCRQSEITRTLQFWWADHNYSDGRFRVYDKAGKEVLLIGEEIAPDLSNINYLLTGCRTLDRHTLYREGEFVLYKIK